MPVSQKIRIAGQVQGVGFRPFVYNLARRFDINGYVSNDERGVVIHLEADNNGIDQSIAIDRFYRELINNPPPLARIRSHALEPSENENCKDFRIRNSQKEGPLNLQLTPDFGICDSCKEEIADPENRRHGYPFTTCVNCGPRWALTRDFPFEREHTSLDEFTMCPACAEEYTDPSNRRFHSQTNSCSNCGVSLELFDANGNQLKLPDSGLFREVARLISSGKVVAIKNTGGYLLCCDADNPEAVMRLRERKRRPSKPFALMYPSLDAIEAELDLNAVQRATLLSVPRPIVILPFKNYSGKLALESIAPGLRQLGAMLPYSGLLELLARELTRPIVATSGNLHGSPILSEEDEAMSILTGVADFFVHHNLHIENPQDDSVVKISQKGRQQIMFRRSRGYAPNFFDFEAPADAAVMAMGSQLKSTLAFLPNTYLYQSQYLGNLDNYDVYERFQQTVRGFIRIFEREPECILVDAHPQYLSTRSGRELALEFDAPCHEIQHHKAHFASVLGEHELFACKEPVLGVIWDGTGYGDDGQIWGGEFFMYRDHTIDRWSHLEYFDWIAGDKMALEPRLSLLSLSDSSMLPTVASKFSEEEMRIYGSLLKSNRMKTSSMGRLFDAAASLLGLCDRNSYEGEAAILLENHVGSFDLKKCRCLIEEVDKKTFSPRELLRRIFEEKERGQNTEMLAIDFLYTLASVVRGIAVQSGVSKVAFSGGVFQNSILVDMIRDMLRSEYDTYFNVNLAPNDENIAHGQIMYHLNQVR